MPKRIALFLSVVMIFSSLTGCSRSNNGSKNLSKYLFSDFTFEANYTLVSSLGEISGNARILKGETTKIELLSPEPYSGLTAESDSAGAPSQISFSYDGVNMNVPSDAISKLNLALFLFSPDIAQAVDTIKGNSITNSEEVFDIAGLTNITPMKAEFVESDIPVTIIYDKNTGTPLRFYAGSDDTSLTINVTKIKINE